MKSTAELRKEGNLNPQTAQIPTSEKVILWMFVDVMSLMCLFRLIFSITGVPAFSLDTTFSRVFVISILIVFWLILIIKFKIKKDTKRIIRRLRIFALSCVVSIISVFILDGFQGLIGRFLFPEFYDLVPCTMEEIEIASIYYSRYLVLSILLTIIVPAFSFSISYICISLKGKNKKQKLTHSKVEEKVEQPSQGESWVSYSNHSWEFWYKSATKVKLFFFIKKFVD